MATYAVGDIQGCASEFEALLQAMSFNASDELWLVGDLVNRGPRSLDVMRQIYAIKDQCRVVLGNHDLHFLAIYFGGHKPGKSDTFDELLASPQVDDFAHWLRGQKLFHRRDNWVMTHAGVPHIWTLAQAEQLAAEVEHVLADLHDTVSYEQFFSEMYGNDLVCWQSDVSGMPRFRLITNYFTRMRLVHEDGTMDFSHKGAIADAPAGWHPWFEFAASVFADVNIVFGHWAALDGMTGHSNMIALDTGCVWGRHMTGLCLETGRRYQIQAD